MPHGHRLRPSPDSRAFSSTRSLWCPPPSAAVIRSYVRERIVIDVGHRDREQAMVVVRFKVQSQPDKSEQVLAALRDVVAPSRALPGTISFDIGRDVADSDSFIATEVFEDQAALERQEQLPEV